MWECSAFLTSELPTTLTKQTVLYDYGSGSKAFFGLWPCYDVTTFWRPQRHFSSWLLRSHMIKAVNQAQLFLYAAYYLNLNYSCLRLIVGFQSYFKFLNFFKPICRHLRWPYLKSRWHHVGSRPRGWKTLNYSVCLNVKKMPLSSVTSLRKFPKTKPKMADCCVVLQPMDALSPYICAFE